jgi:hypothetical protein
MYAEGFLISIPSDSHWARNLTAARSTSRTSRRSSTTLCFSARTSLRSSTASSDRIRPLSVKTMHPRPSNPMSIFNIGINERRCPTVQASCQAQTIEKESGRTVVVREISGNYEFSRQQYGEDGAVSDLFESTLADFQHLDLGFPGGRWYAQPCGGAGRSCNSASGFGQGRLNHFFFAVHELL